VTTFVANGATQNTATATTTGSALRWSPHLHE
jgi:hypothetical protein